MKKSIYYLFFLSFFILAGLYSISGFAQNQASDTLPDEYVNTNYLRYENHVYKENIKTPLLYRSSDELTFPVLKLGETGTLTLRFDDFEGGVKNYYYTVIHCDINWNPSPILFSYYIDGLDKDQITDYKYSFNTIRNYTHYRAVFPNEVMKPKLPGNYILLVFLNSDREDIVLSKRFIVVEEQLEVTGKISRPMSIDTRNYNQEVDFTVHIEKYPIADPYHELEVILLQNHRWDKHINNLKPSLIKDNHLIFDFSDENIFPGGNEFRRFDIRSLRYKSERIRHILPDSGETHIILYADETRTIKKYNPETDLNGKRFIHIQEGSDDDIEADYVWVHFRLAYDVPVQEGTLYVFGALSDWQCTDEFKMKFNQGVFGYETIVLLKQGYYNYEYVLIKDRSGAADHSFIEGNHFETENDYTVLIYQHDFLNNYDRLIGLKEFNSVKDF